MIRKLLNVSGVIIVVFLIAAVLPLTLPRVFGLELYQVLTASMEPEIPVGSVIYVKSCLPETLEIGDVITFALGTDSDVVETHRVAAVDAENQWIVTKGDANQSVDQTKVLFQNVKGKVIFHIPKLGFLSEAIRSAQGIATCVVIFASVLIMWLVADRLKSKEKAP